jgi:outer membrane receptor for ferrienterochelin and colicin
MLFPRLGAWAYCWSLALFLVHDPAHAQPARHDASDGKDDEPQRIATDDLMNMTLEELLMVGIFEEETVSASRKTQQMREAPATIFVITAEQLRHRGIQTVGEALECVPGLDLIHDHTQHNLGIRGINGGLRASSRIVKVMIDGQPVSFRPTAEHFLGEELIPISVIDRIEVIRGPASTLYGANAFLGVINIITKNGGQVDTGKALARYGRGKNTTLYGGELLVGSETGDFDFIAAGVFVLPYERGYRLRNIPGNAHARQAEKSEAQTVMPQSYFGKLRYGNDDIGRFVLDVNLQHQDRSAEFQDWGALTHNNRVSLYNLYVRGQYTATIEDVFDWNLSIAHARGEPTKWDHLDYDTDNGQWVERELGYKSFDFLAQGTYNLDSWSSLSAGIDVSIDDHTPLTYSRVDGPSGRRVANPGSDPRDFQKVFTNGGAFLQAIIYPFRLFDTDVALGLTGGTRFEHHNIYGHVTNYRAGVVYRFTDWLHSKLLYGTSFKAPSSTQLHGNFLSSGGVISNPNLKPERARTVEAAIAGQISQHTSFSINAFRSTIEDKVEIDLPGPATAANFYPQNSESISSYGAEAEFSFAIHRLTGYVNYSFQESTLTKKDPSLVDDSITSVSTTLYPKHMFKWGTNYRIPSIFINLNIQGRHIGSRTASQLNNFVYSNTDYLNNRYTLPAYTLLDTSISTVGLRPLGAKETALSLKVYNVFDTSYAYPGFRDFDIPGFSRTFVVTIAQEF